MNQASSTGDNKTNETTNQRNLHDGGIHISLSGDAPGPHSMGTTPIPNSNKEQIRSLDDLALTHISLDEFPEVKAWRDKLFDPEWIPEICDELPRLLTEFLRKPENEVLPPYTRRARALQHVFRNKTPLVRDTDLLPGQTTTSFVGPVMYMDMSGYCIWPELHTISKRPQSETTEAATVPPRRSRWWKAN